jgi:hypothetical protein
MKVRQDEMYGGSLMCALIVSIVPFVVFWDVTVGRQIWATGDFSAFHHPLFVVSTDQWRHGILPLWNPYAFGGTPLAAAQQAGIFYPLNVFLWLFLPPWEAMGLSILVHLALTGLGTFLFLRSLGLHCLSALLGGLVFTWGGFTMSHLGHVGILRALPWIGVSLYGFNAWSDTQKRRYLFCIAVATAFLFLSGYPQTVVYSISLIGTYFLFARRARWSSIALGLTALGLGVCLSGIQVIPGVELWASQQYLRPGEGDYRASMGYSFHPAYLATFLFPRVRPGTLAEMVSYSGIIPLVLAGLSCIQGGEGQHRRIIRFFFLWSLFALALAFGRFLPPLAKLIFHIPAYGSFGVPSKHFLEFSFCLAVLSAYGLEGLIRQQPLRKLQRNEMAFLGLGSSGVLILALFAPFAEDVPALDWTSSVKGTIQPILIIALGVLLIYAAFRANAKYRLSISMALILITFFDLLDFGLSIYSYALTTPDFYKIPPSTAKLLRRETGKLDPFRIIAFEATGVMQKRELAKELLAANYHTAYKVESLIGHDGLMLRRLHAEFEGAIPPWGDVAPDFIEQRKFRSLLNLYGVRYLLVKSDKASLLSKYYKPLYSTEEVSVFENDQARSRLFPLIPYRGTEGAAETILVDEYKREWVSSLNSTSSAVTITLRDYNEGRLAADVAFEQDGVLVHGTNYVSGWHATIDGVPTSIFLVTGSLQGVSVPQGQHRVEFWYAPESMKWGAAISALAGGGIALLCLWPRVRRLRHGEGTM